jgi:hypothetical protein
MKPFSILAISSFLSFSACTKPQSQPTSKTDYLPIISSKSPLIVSQGQPIISIVKMGFYEHSADIKFLNFEIKETLPKQYDIRAKALYDNIQYGISLPVVSTFDTTMILQTTTAGSGKYFLKFYSFNQLIQTDTVVVN